MFASAIPEIAQIIGNRPKYAGSYKMEKGKRFNFKILMIIFSSCHF